MRRTVLRLCIILSETERDRAIERHAACERFGYGLAAACSAGLRNHPGGGTAAPRAPRTHVAPTYRHRRRRYFTITHGVREHGTRLYTGCSTFHTRPVEFITVL